MPASSSDPPASAAHEPDASAGGAGAPPAPGEPNRAPATTREYRTEQIAVQWFAERCTHSANCFRALPQVFDPGRVFANQKLREILNGGDHTAGMPFESCFSPAVQTRLIGFYLYENPVAHARVHYDCFDICDLH